MKNTESKFAIFRKNRVNRNVETKDEVNSDNLNDIDGADGLDDDLDDDEDFDDYLKSRYEEGRDEEEEDLLSI
jgi:hypothetical protein